MKCMNCGAATVDGTTSDVFDVGDSVIVIRNIPCRKCTECAEVIYSGSVIRELEKIIARAKVITNGDEQSIRLSKEEAWNIFLEGLNGFTEDFLPNGREPQGTLDERESL